MIESINTMNTIGINSSEISGLDALMDIQLLLVKDFDEQIGAQAKQIKALTNVKKGYRQEIQALQAILTRPLSNPKEEKTEKQRVGVTAAEAELLQNNTEYVPNLQDGSAAPISTPVEFDVKAKNEAKKTSDPTTIVRTDKTMGHKDAPAVPSPRILVTAKSVATQKEENYTHTANKDAVQKKIEQISTKLDQVNSQSEIVSLNVQSLTSQRKTAFETISSVISKYGDTLASIVRNMNN